MSPTMRRVYRRAMCEAPVRDAVARLCGKVACGLPSGTVDERARAADYFVDSALTALVEALECHGLTLME